MLIIENFKYSGYSTDIDKTVLTHSSTFFFKNKIIEGIMIFEVILPIYLKNVFSLIVKGWTFKNIYKLPDFYMYSLCLQNSRHTKIAFN